MSAGTSICHYTGYDLLLSLNLFYGGTQNRLDRSISAHRTGFRFHWL